MNTAGDAADQVVRYSLEAGEVALKLTGEGAKELAVLLYTILKEEKKERFFADAQNDKNISSE